MFLAVVCLNHRAGALRGGNGGTLQLISCMTDINTHRIPVYPKLDGKRKPAFFRFFEVRLYTVISSVFYYASVINYPQIGGAFLHLVVRDSRVPPAVLQARVEKCRKS